MTEEELRVQMDILNELIEENNNRGGVSDTTVRFSSAEWFEAIQQSSILVAGVGGIGSWFALLLSRMRPLSITLMDDDFVEMVNMAGQLYQVEDVDKYKVEALADTINAYSAYRAVTAINQKFTEDSEAYDIMVCGFDNMKARTIYFKKWLSRVKSLDNEGRKKCLFIDGRLNAEKFQVISITGTDYYAMKKYAKEFLFDDNQVSDALCSYKQTTYCAAMIASFMCNVIVNFFSNSDARPVLFFQEYDASFMSLKQES